MAEIKTRIQLKYDSYTNWTNANTLLKQGEVAIVTLAEDLAQETNADTKQPILMKVGPGNFNSLPWTSALAADVHAWAKKSETEFIAWMNENVQHPAAPDLTPYLTAADITTGSANGTIAVRGTDVEVKGLGSAAYTDAGAYATSAQGEKADSAVQAIALAGGTNNGTVKLTVDGTISDNIAVTGLQDAAYTTVEALNATAKGYADAVEAKLPTSADYGVLFVSGKDAIKVTSGQNPEVSLALDASGNVVLSQSATGLKAAIDLSAYRLIADDEDTTYGLAYDSENKVIKLVEGGSNLEIPASDFVADGMLQSVVADKENNTLTFTWNTDGGSTVTTVNLTDIADIYTGKNGTTINVSVSNTNEISAEINPKSITSAYLADDLVTAINKDDNTTYTVASTANALEFTVTPSEGSAQTVKLVAPTIDTGVMSVVTGKTNGTIEVDGEDVAVKGLGSAAYTSADSYATSAENGAKGIAEEALDTVTTLASDLKSGMVIVNAAKCDENGNNIKETYATKNEVTNLTTDDIAAGTNIWIFNCGTSTTVID